jgi:acetyl-CoA acetyltransferase
MLIYCWVQDNFSIQSYEKAIAAQKNGGFDWKIIPVRFLLHPFYLC